MVNKIHIMSTNHIIMNAYQIRLCSKIDGIKLYILTEIIKFISHQLCSFLRICLFQFQSKPLIMKEIYCSPEFFEHSHF